MGLFLLAFLSSCGDDDAAPPLSGEPDAGGAGEFSETLATGASGSSGATETRGSEETSTADVSSSMGAAADAGETEATSPSDLDGGTSSVSDGSVVETTDGSVDTTSPEDTSGETGELPPEPEGALYGLGVQVYDGNTWLSYLVTTDTLRTHIDTNSGVELQGRILAVGPEAAGVIYVTNGTTVTRYRLNGQDALETDGPVLSFSGLGVTDIHEYGGQFVFESADKAYFFDGDNSQVVVWNPDEMTVGQPIPLDIVPSGVDGVIITYSAAPIRTEGRVITFAGLRQSVVPVPPTAVIVLDTENDEAEVVTDDRCGYVRDGVLADDGWVYLATEAYASAYHRINESGDIEAPCLLRFDPEEKQFDDEFKVELASLTGGDAAGTLAVAGNGSVYLKVLDEALSPISIDSNARVVASLPAWNWAKLQVGESPTVELLDTTPTSGSVTPFTLGERRVVLTNRRAEVNGVEMTISDISEFNDGPSEVVGTVDGLVFSITQLK